MCPTPSSPPPMPTGRSPRRGDSPAAILRTRPCRADNPDHVALQGGSVLSIASARKRRVLRFQHPGFILSMQSVQSFERECSRFDCLHIGSLNAGGRASPNEVAFPLPASTQWTISEPDAVAERGSGRDRETGRRALRECACTMSPSCQTPAAASIPHTNDSQIVFAEIDEKLIGSHSALPRLS